jgi:hypothetical protein
MDKIPFNQLQRVKEMTTDVGMIQHSKKSNPDTDSSDYHAYSIDDSARALIVVSRFHSWAEDGMNKKYLDFIERAKRKDGFFNNYQNSEGKPLEEEIGLLGDCFGRTLWGLSEFITSEHPGFSKKDKERAKTIFNDSIGLASFLKSPHSLAFSLIATSKMGSNQYKEGAEEIALKLNDFYIMNLEHNWNWFSDSLTYCNARLPHAMLLAGEFLDKREFIEVGKKSLDFLIKHSFSLSDNRKDIVFHAIGNKGWYSKESIDVPKYDQQPVEAGCMTETCCDAARILKEPRYLELFGKKAFEWYHGRNINKVNMLSPEGGVYDGITPVGINSNQGAESVLVYLMGYSKLE